MAVPVSPLPPAQLQPRRPSRRLLAAVVLMSSVISSVAAGAGGSEVDAAPNKLGNQGKGQNRGSASPSPSVTRAPTATPTNWATNPPTPAPTPTAPATATPTSGAYSFQEEFSGSTIGSVWGRNWGAFGSTAAWDRSHSSVANGVLTITLSKDSRGWVGDLLDTKYTFEQRYGYFESRIRFDKGDGLWPAFWVSQTPDVRYPEELDVMEVCANSIGRYSWPNDARDLHTTIHFNDGSQAYNDYLLAGDLSGAWHVYAMDWRSDRVIFYLDGVEVWRYTGGNIPATAMPVVLDFAMGGSWCGGATSTTPAASIMQVDYVRVSP